MPISGAWTHWPLHASANEAPEARLSPKNQIPRERIAICAQNSLSHSDEDNESYQRPRSSDEEIVGIMKNMLFNILHGIPVNYHDFFMRTLANVALSPFEMKPYAPWIMRFLRTRSSLNYKPDFENHLSYLPLIEVLK